MSEQPRRRLRFSLRAILLVTTAIAILLSAYMVRVRTQQVAVQKLAKLDRAVGYEPTYYWEPSPWLVERLGVHHFSTATKFSLNAEDFLTDDPKHLEQIVDQLVRLPRLRSLFIRYEYPGKIGTEEGRQLARLAQLESIYMHGGAFAAETLMEMSDMPNLKSLSFERDAYLDLEAYEAAAKIESLETIFVTDYSQQCEQRLKELRPDINLYLHYDYVP